MNTPLRDDEEKDLDTVLEALRGAGEESRLRILAALGHGELTVSELTHVLAQSQPRISRHLKLMTDAGLIERRREGSWAFFRLARRGFGAALTRFILDSVDADDPFLLRDKERRAQIRQRRAEQADAYFRENAAEWDRLRALHAEEQAVEEAAQLLLRPESGSFERFVDLGAGTGRMLEVFADRYDRAIGYDVSQQMLSLARSRLEDSALPNVDLRLEDILALPEKDGVADAAVLHQVLHFLAEPSMAVAEAARILMPRGKLLIVDFAPHELEFLRDHHAHLRLGFGREEVEEMALEAALKPLDYLEIEAPKSLESQGLTVSLWLMEKAA